MQNSALCNKFNFALKAEDLARTPKFAPEELTNQVDIVRRILRIESELTSLSVNVAGNTERVEKIEQKAPSNSYASKAKAASLKPPPHVQRVKSLNIPEGPMDQSSPVTSKSREGTPRSGKRRRTSVTDGDFDWAEQNDTIVNAEEEFVSDGHSSKDRRKARHKAIRGKMQDTELAGGSAEVDIVVAGVRKCHGIPDVVKHINKAGTTNGSDVALTEDKCELLESKDNDLRLEHGHSRKIIGFLGQKLPFRSFFFKILAFVGKLCQRDTVSFMVK